MHKKYIKSYNGYQKHFISLILCNVLWNPNQPYGIQIHAIKSVKIVVFSMYITFC